MSSVDASHISATAPQRRDSLEKHLQQRPDARELKERHILLDSNAAPGLQAAQAELERAQVADALRKGLEKRPEKEELVEREFVFLSITDSSE